VGSADASSEGQRRADTDARWDRGFMRIRVLHVLEAIEGGVARHIVNLVRHVDAEHVVALPSERVGGVTDTAAINAIAAAGATVEHLDMRRSPVSPRTLAAVPKVHRMITRLKPDIVHGHSAIGGAVARIAAVGTRAARVYTPHGLYPSLSACAFERALGPLTDRLIAASTSEGEFAQHLRLIPRERMAVIPNALELDGEQPPPFNLRAMFGVDSDTPVVGTVARLAPQKAPEIFVRACARVATKVPEARFVLIGDGPLVHDVRAELSATDLDGNFLLLRDRPDGDRLMAQFDVFALSSRYEAGAPFATMEAMRAGRPVVVTDVIGNRDSVEPGRSGFVVPPEDPDALADAIVCLLGDSDLRERIGEAGRDRVVSHFDVRQSSADLSDLYEEVVKERAH
jgi:glycosyltransferase involved in cell wall biosynthesis